jgi:hypothetical protein
MSAAREELLAYTQRLQQRTSERVGGAEAEAKRERGTGNRRILNTARRDESI